METKKDYTNEIHIYMEVLNRLYKNFENNNYRECICVILNLSHFSYLASNFNYKLHRLEIKKYLINHKPINAVANSFWFPRNKEGLQSRIELVRKVINDLNKLQN